MGNLSDMLDKIALMLAFVSIIRCESQTNKLKKRIAELECMRNLDEIERELNNRKD